MVKNILKILLNPIFPFTLCIIICFSYFNNYNIFFIIFCISLALLSFIISIIKINNFSKDSMILSIIIIFIISIISIFCVLTGYLAWVLLFFILIISIIVSLITITFSTKRKINYILNYILLFFILSVLIGEVYVYHKNYSYEKELLQIAKIIEDYYYDTNKEYDSDEINKLLEENKMKRYRVEINENYFTISILTKNTGWIYGIGYNSEDKSIYKDYKK